MVPVFHSKIAAEDWANCEQIKRKDMFIVQFNEVNFDLVKKYGCNELPRLFDLLSNLHEVETTSEQRYEHLEPWIQWVSLYTGQPYRKHGVFHLGDYKTLANRDLFANAKKKGKKIGMFACMNHPGVEGEYFLPDPWSLCDVNGDTELKYLDEIMRFVVNRNSGLKIPWKMLPKFLLIFRRLDCPVKYRLLTDMLYAIATRNRGQLAACLDVLLLCFAIDKHTKLGLDLTGVFLNGVAHIQHHYMFSSKVVNGNNPSWYVKPGKDPLLECLKIYENAFGWLSKQGLKVAVITGLSQLPVAEPEFYWRFTDHQNFIGRLFHKSVSIQPRMSRDFHIYFENETDAQAGINVLKECKIETGKSTVPAFGFLEIYGTEVFATFIYAGGTSEVTLRSGQKSLPLKGNITFLASKNAEHQQRGWAFLPKASPFSLNKKLPIWDLNKQISDFIQ